jgi:hypothetical protein
MQHAERGEGVEGGGEGLGTMEKCLIRTRHSHCSSHPMGELHCNENPIYVFPEKELHGLSPNFHIHVSVSDFYIPRIGPHIFLQQNRQTRECGNLDTCRAIPFLGIFV